MNPAIQAWTFCPLALRQGQNVSFTGRCVDGQLLIVQWLSRNGTLVAMFFPCDMASHSGGKTQ
jgi:hypothetical protein